ncbi:hypothetical protein BSL78_04069, partial [Apostichopus japonicus]
MNEGSKETTEHGLDETTPLSSVQQTKLDIFICGLCDIACNEAGDFLRHKISHDTWNGIYFCLLCKTKELSQESIHHHYLYFHNVQTLTSEEILPDNLDEVSCLSSKPHSVTQQGLDEAVNLHSKVMGAPEHIILSCDRDASTSTSSEPKISPFVCTGKERATEGREHCL